MIKKLKVFIIKCLRALKFYDFVCCICGKGSKGFGNNPETNGAQKYSLDDECCDECNATIVVPARFGNMF